MATITIRKPLEQPLLNLVCAYWINRCLSMNCSINSYEFVLTWIVSDTNATDISCIEVLPINITTKPRMKPLQYWWLLADQTNGYVRDHWIPLTHYDGVIMSATASQITSLTIVYSTVYSGAVQSKPWIPRANGQWRGKCFHLMTSSSKRVSNAENLPMSWRHHA